MASIELPDVNVLLALYDTFHVHHEAAQNWFASVRDKGWATCPLTENGFLRIISNPTYPNSRLSVPEAAKRLRVVLANTAATHQFWADDVSLCDTTRFDLSILRGHKQLTDLYLLGLCQQHSATLVTFDGGAQETMRAIVHAHADLLRLLTP